MIPPQKLCSQYYTVKRSNHFWSQYLHKELPKLSSQNGIALKLDHTIVHRLTYTCYNFQKSSTSYWLIYRVLNCTTCIFLLKHNITSCISNSPHPTWCIVALSVALLVVAVYHLCPTILFIKVITENNVFAKYFYFA